MDSEMPYHDADDAPMDWRTTSNTLKQEVDQAVAALHARLDRHERTLEARFSSVAALMQDFIREAKLSMVRCESAESKLLGLAQDLAKLQEQAKWWSHIGMLNTLIYTLVLAGLMWALSNTLLPRLFLPGKGGP